VAKTKQGASSRRPAGGQGGRGGRPPGAGRSRTTEAPSHRSAIIAWVSALVVVAVILVIVIVKVTGSSNNQASGRGPVPADVLVAVTHVPLSALEAAGTSGTTPATIKAITNATPLTSNGKPELFYAGAEYCPYCAAQRWAMIVALSRFGTFSNLSTMQSSTQAGEPYPGTQTFTFHGSSYSSPYLVFTPVEMQTNQLSGGTYTTLETPTPAQQQLINTYDKAPYSSSTGGIPFIDYANKYVSSGAMYDPQILQNLSRETIAGSLSDPSTPTAQAINSTANMVTAAICKITNGQPGNVCNTQVIQKAISQLPNR
jgi:hypothetical protein